jgi:hypothetical protein
MPQPPKMSPEQREAALAKAAHARRTRAEAKELLRTGSLSLRELLERADHDDVLAGMKVFATLAALPGLGKVKAGRLMDDIGIAADRRIRGLGGRQRQALLDALS